MQPSTGRRNPGPRSWVQADGVTGYSMFRSRLIADPYRTVAKTSLRRAVITLAANRGCSFTHRLLEKMAVGHEQEKCSSMPKFARRRCSSLLLPLFPRTFPPHLQPRNVTFFHRC
uniref:Uncharacterized protein LOC112822427 n=1 Tax=Callorhinus ursinus TaxID=34884 RepID=A0A3Q7NWE5_CALUR|nr:uncharacterized protein LOC112822427 [Callorhinus ursinus]